MFLPDGLVQVFKDVLKRKIKRQIVKHAVFQINQRKINFGLFIDAHGARISWY